MDVIINELIKYHINDPKIECLSNKDGVLVYKVSNNGNNYVLKYFMKDEYKREITYYSLLNKLGIKTITVIGYTGNSILMEDINVSEDYRLATKDDLKRNEVVLSLAEFYCDLHKAGIKYFRENAELELYSEFKSINKESILFLKQKSGYENEMFWKELLQFISKVRPYYDNNRTLTYNDFFYGNMIVSKDLNEAFMFDYNFLGEGLKYFDISNVLHMLTDEMKDIFIEKYGDVTQVEKYINDVVSHVFTLITAYKREKYPSWAVESKELLLSGKIYEYLKTANAKFNEE